jgi:hypothetical protein
MTKKYYKLKLKDSDVFLRTDSVALYYTDSCGDEHTLYYIILDENGDGEEYSTNSYKHVVEVVNGIIDPVSSSREYSYHEFKPEYINIIEVIENYKVVKINV